MIGMSSIRFLQADDLINRVALDDAAAGPTEAFSQGLKILRLEGAQRHLAGCLDDMGNIRI